MHNARICNYRDNSQSAVQAAVRSVVEALENRMLLAAQWDRPDFGGNPYVTITEIDISDEITVSREDGELPFFVQVSASDISATGTSRPYEDLEYSWDFGDAGGSETLANPATGEAVNANTGQTGPEAAYVYRTADEYTITLTVRGKNGGSFVTETFQTTVEALAFTGNHVFYDPAGGNDNNPGTQGSPKQTLPDAIPANEWAHIRRGTTVLRPHSTSNNLLMGSHSRISAYDVGADPIILRTGEAASTDDAMVLKLNGVNDVVVSDVTLRTASDTDMTQVVEVLGGGVNDIYFDNADLDAQGMGPGEDQGDGGIRDVVEFVSGQARSGFWKTNVSSAGEVARHGIYGPTREWAFFVGNNISGGGSSHHIYAQVRNHSLYRWNTFSAGEGRHFTLNINAPTGEAYYEAHYHLIADNYLEGTGTEHAIDIGTENNNTNIATFFDVVIQGNAMTDYDKGLMLADNLEEGSIRDNVAWDNNQIGTDDLLDFDEFSDSQPLIYNNLIHSDAKRVVQLGHLTQPFQFRDNIIFGTETPDAHLVDASFSNTHANSVINGNQYYAPNDSDSEFLVNEDNDFTVDFGPQGTSGTWQNAGFDVNGSVGNPGWVDPANGNFLTSGGGTVGISGGVLTATGTSGNDTITIERTGTDDVIVTINGGTPAQFDMDDFPNGVSLVGLAGNDTIIVEDSLLTPVARTVAIYGGHGDDTLVGNDGADTIDGGAGNDSITGAAGNDSIIGGFGNDTIDGGAGAADTVDGGPGVDQLTGNEVSPTNGSVSIVSNILTANGDWGMDYIRIQRTGTDDVIVTINDGTPFQADMDDFTGVRLNGNAGFDFIEILNPLTSPVVRPVTLDGGNGNDSLIGGTAGNDSLVGGDGDDFLDSADAAGGDTVAGGNGTDSADVDGGDTTSSVEVFV